MQAMPRAVAETIHVLGHAELAGRLVPHVVAEQGGVVAIAFDQGGDEPANRIADIVIVEAKPRASTGLAAGRNGTVLDLARIRHEPRGGEGLEGPLRRRIVDDADNRFQAVLGGQVKLQVVVRPVVGAGRDLYGGPHEPVPQNTEADAVRAGIVPVPFLGGRIGFAEIDRAGGKGVGDGGRRSTIRRMPLHRKHRQRHERGRAAENGAARDLKLRHIHSLSSGSSGTQGCNAVSCPARHCVSPRPADQAMPFSSKAMLFGSL